MSNTNSIGPSIHKAFRFFREVHKDTLAVVEALDVLMEERGWYPTQSNRISNDLSNGSYPTRWLIQSIYRLYANNTDTKTAERIVAMHIVFGPPDSYDEPVCLCVAARFQTATSTHAMWNQWEYQGSERLLEHIGGKGQANPIPQALIKGILPLANVGEAFVVNLCALTSEPALKQAVVDPLLAALERM